MSADRPPPGTRVLIPDDGGPIATVEPYDANDRLIPVVDDFGVPHRYRPDQLKIVWTPGLV